MMPYGNAITAQDGRLALTPRDTAILQLVGRFRLVAAEQIRALLFQAQASKTPLDRALLRLTAGGYLARLGRLVGGFGGGSGQYVYQLGRKGWRSLGKGGAYRPLRTVDLHTLTITECFVQLHRLENRGALTVIEYRPEPAAHLHVGGTALTPDAYVELGVHSTRTKFTYWLEIDRDTENADVIRGKLSRYWHAYQAWDGDVFPYVVFVVPDESRGQELGRIIAGGPEQAHAIFQVYTSDEFGEHVAESCRLCE